MRPRFSLLSHVACHCALRCKCADTCDQHLHDYVDRYKTKISETALKAAHLHCSYWSQESMARRFIDNKLVVTRLLRIVRGSRLFICCKRRRQPILNQSVLIANEEDRTAFHALIRFPLRGRQHIVMMQLGPSVEVHPIFAKG